MTARMSAWRYRVVRLIPVAEQIFPCGPWRHRFVGRVGLIHREPVAKLRIITVSVERGIGSVRLVAFGGGDGVGQPAVVGLSGDLEYPARHRHGDSVGGEVTDERVAHFPGR